MPAKKKAPKKAAAKASKPAKIVKETQRLCDEEVAYRMVNLYFQEIARLGFKRRLNLDAIINAYFYSLKRLQNKEKEMEAIDKIVKQEEAALSTQNKKDMFPTPE